MYFLIDSRGGMLAAQYETRELYKLDEDWCRYVLLADESLK